MSKNDSKCRKTTVIHWPLCKFTAIDTLLDKISGSEGARFAMGPCLCQLSLKRWEEPIVKEIFLVYAADIFAYLYKSYRIVSSDEIKRVLRECHDAGLVHELDYCMQSGKWSFCICNCEPRICILTRAYLKTGKLLSAGPEVVLYDPDLCVGKERCGQCFKKIIFGANFLKDGKVTVDYEICLGCGLCVPFCKGKARSMVVRENYKLDKKIPAEILLGK